MTSKFEQLIEYVINDEEAKAKELFHDIVVEKSAKSMKTSWTRPKSLTKSHMMKLTSVKNRC
jgi:hypothetical protein